MRRPDRARRRGSVVGVTALAVAVTVLAAVAALVGVGTVPAGAGPTLTATIIDRPAIATAPAVTGTSVQLLPLPTAPADPECQPPDGVPATARQVVRVAATGTFARVDLLELDGGTWTCTRRAMTGRVGRNGVRPLAQRVSGDGTTPAGIFPLGTMTAPDGEVFQFFGNGVDPGVKGSWRQVRSGDCWDATGGRATYNTLTRRAAAACTGEDEYLAASPGAYSRVALIGANMGPDRSGDQAGEVPRAAAIFLHRFSYDAAGASRPTSGCVSLAGDDLDAVLTALVPGQTWFVITAT